MDPQWENKRNCIETTFWLSKEMNNDVLEIYKSMVEKFDFFKPTSSGNFKWQLNDQSTYEEMQRLMDAIETVAKKINE